MAVIVVIILALVLCASVAFNVVLYKSNLRAAGVIGHLNQRCEDLWVRYKLQRNVISGFRQALPGLHKLVRHTPGGGGGAGMPPTRQDVETLAARCKHLNEMLREYDGVPEKKSLEGAPTA